MRRNLTLFFTIAAVVVLLCFVRARAFAQGIVPSRITTAIDNSKLAVLHGNTHPLARPAYDRGAAPDSLQMDQMLLVLQRSPAQQAALDTLLAQQQDKSSPNYHKWLTPQEFGQQFGVSDADVQKVTGWLQSQGFVVNSVSNGRDIINFSGVAGQVRSAFHTTIHQYDVPVNNRIEQHWANSGDPEIPAALTPVVAGVRSLNNFFPKPAYRANAAHGLKPKTISPHYTFTDEDNNTYYAPGPTDLSTIYDFASLWNSGITGTGETIAIVSASDISATDVSQFRSLFGLPAINFSQIIPTGSTNPGIVGPNATSNGAFGDEDETEAVFDVEFSGSVAKGAKIDLVASADTTSTAGIDLSATYIVNSMTPRPQVLTESYGECELALGATANAMYNNLWSQAASEGITVSISTGDTGAAGCDFVNPDVTSGPQPSMYGLAVSGTASTPYDVAVGGTDFSDHTAPSPYWSATNNAATEASVTSYVPEVAWNDVCTSSFIYPFFNWSSALSACNGSNTQYDGNADDWFYVAPIGGSGGVSTCTTLANTSGTDATSQCTGGWLKPSWQSTSITGVPNDGKRDIPDVSFFAEESQSSYGLEQSVGDIVPGSFYIACQADLQGGSCSITNGVFLLAGGTSVSTQVFGGMVALIDQKTGSSSGNLNPALYAAAANENWSSCNATGGSLPASTCVFNDVTSGTIAMPCTTAYPQDDGTNDCVNDNEAIGVQTSTNVNDNYNAGTGYDLATGLGSLNVAAFVGGAPYLNAAANPTSFTAPGSTVITFTPENGYTGTVNLTTSPLPSGYSATFTPSSSLTFNNSTAQQVTFALASTASVPPSAWTNFPAHWLPIATLGLLAILGAAFAIAASNKRRLRWGAGFALAGLIVVVAFAGCSSKGSSGSGGGGGSGTVVNVLVTDSSTNETLSVPITVTVP